MELVVELMEEADGGGSVPIATEIGSGSLWNWC